LAAAIDTARWRIPPLFEVLRRIGNIPLDDYRRTFNLGVGMVLVVKADRVDDVLADLHAAEEPAWVLGRLTPGSGVVRYR